MTWGLPNFPKEFVAIDNVWAALRAARNFQIEQDVIGDAIVQHLVSLRLRPRFAALVAHGGEALFEKIEQGLVVLDNERDRYGVFFQHSKVEAKSTSPPPKNYV
jgi:hypothetical protein